MLLTLITVCTIFLYHLRGFRHCINCMFFAYLLYSGSKILPDSALVFDLIDYVSESESSSSEVIIVMSSLGGIWVSLMCVISVSLPSVVRSMYCGGIYLTWNTSFVITASESFGLSILMRMLQLTGS